MQELNEDIYFAMLLTERLEVEPASRKHIWSYKCETFLRAQQQIIVQLSGGVIALAQEMLECFPSQPLKVQLSIHYPKPKLGRLS